MDHWPSRNVFLFRREHLVGKEAEHRAPQGRALHPLFPSAFALLGRVLGRLFLQPRLVGRAAAQALLKGARRLFLTGLLFHLCLGLFPGLLGRVRRLLLDGLVRGLLFAAHLVPKLREKRPVGLGLQLRSAGVEGLLTEGLADGLRRGELRIGRLRSRFGGGLLLRTGFLCGEQVYELAQEPGLALACRGLDHRRPFKGRSIGLGRCLSFHEPRVGRSGLRG